MNDVEVRELWLYGRELWPTSFTMPSEDILDRVKLRVWQDALGDLDMDLVARTMLGAGGAFPPSPHDLRDLALIRQRLERGDHGIPDVDEALAECARLVSHFGYIAPNEALEAADLFSPVLGATLRAIGWQEVCMDENPGVFRGQFRMIYETASKRIAKQADAPAPALAPYLPMTPEQLGQIEHALQRAGDPES